MKMKLIIVAAATLLAAGCQTGDPNGPQASKTKKWVQFSYQSNDPFEIVDAKCKMAANGTSQGFYAQGRAEFVAGAALGNAIGNAIRMHQFYTQCMTISGWKQITVVKEAPPRPKVKKNAT